MYLATKLINHFICLFQLSTFPYSEFLHRDDKVLKWQEWVQETNDWCLHTQCTFSFLMPIWCALQRVLFKWTKLLSIGIVRILIWQVKDERKCIQAKCHHSVIYCQCENFKDQTRSGNLEAYTHEWRDLSRNKLWLIHSPKRSTFFF